MQRLRPARPRRQADLVRVAAAAPAYSAPSITCWRASASSTRRPRPIARARPLALSGFAARRRLRDRRKQRDLGPAQIGDGLVEIPAGGMRDAVAAVAVRRQPQILGEHRRAAVARGQHQGGRRLDRFRPHIARRRVLHARHLHGDRRGAGAPMAACEVLPQRPRDGQEIDPGVMPEPPVFERQGGADDARRRGDDPISVGHPPPAIGCERLVPDLGEEGAVAVVEDRRRRRRRQMRAQRHLEREQPGDPAKTENQTGAQCPPPPSFEAPGTARRAGRPGAPQDEEFVSDMNDLPHGEEACPRVRASRGPRINSARRLEPRRVSGRWRPAARRSRHRRRSDTSSRLRPAGR